MIDVFEGAYVCMFGTGEYVSVYDGYNAAVARSANAVTFFSNMHAAMDFAERFNNQHAATKLTYHRVKELVVLQEKFSY